MEVSALRYSGGLGVHARSPLLRLQSDERLIALTRRGNQSAFEVLVSRYQSRLLAFCRHLLGSREDAEDILQEVFAAAFNAMVADERPINVRPWLYRIARNRSLNHLRRAQAIGVDSMDIHLSENGASTADKVHDREQFRLLVGDIQGLPETQRTALILREMDALSYEQIAEAMDTTVPGVKSLLVRARISLAEAAEARQLSCEDVRIELAEVAEGLRRRPSPLVRRHMRGCQRCSGFESQLKQTTKELAALLPLGPMVLIKKLLLTHVGHSAGTGSGAAGATGATVGGTSAAAGGAGGAAAGATAAVTSTTGMVTAGAGALATKAAAGLAAAIVTVGAVEASHTHHHPLLRPEPIVAAPVPHTSSKSPAVAVAAIDHVKAAQEKAAAKQRSKLALAKKHKHHKLHSKGTATHATPVIGTLTATGKLHTTTSAKKTPPGRTDTQNDPTVLPGSSTNSSGASQTQQTGPIGAPPPSGSSSSSGSSGSGSSGSGSSGSGTSSGSGSSSGSSSSSGNGNGGGSGGGSGSTKSTSSYQSTTTSTQTTTTTA